MKEDPILSHEQELQAKDKAYMRLQEEHRILQSHYRQAAVVLADFSDATAAAEESLRRFLSLGGLDPSAAFASARQCRHALSQDSERMLAIQEYVTTEYDKVAEELQACQNLVKSYAAYDTWKERLSDWHMHIDNGAYVLTHVSYPLVRGTDLPEVVATALAYQKEVIGDTQFASGVYEGPGN